MLINMKHDKDGEYVYASGVEGPIIEVQVRYSLGGQSFLSGGTNPRGIYIHVTPVTLERHNGYVSRCYSLFGNLIRSGTKILAMELKRKSDKHLLAVAEIVDSMAPAIASLWITDQAAGCRLLQDAVEAVKQNQLVPKIKVRAAVIGSQVSI